MRIRGLLLAGLLALPLPAAAATEKNFVVNDSQDLLELCSVAPADALYREALHFCHGYLVGAYAYMRAATGGPNAPRLVCFPNPPPTRNQAIDGFMAWLRQNPQRLGESPVDTMLRYLQTTFPCRG
jgi:Rap1a immunity proteins